MADVDGLAELKAAFAASVTELSERLPDITEAGATIIKTEIENRAPEKTGELKRDIAIETSRTGNTAQTNITIDDKAYYWRFIEEGTSKMPAKPFVRPAFESTKDAAAEKMVNEISGVIRRAGGSIVVSKG